MAVHDREAWLALFSDDAYIEDPVGSAPNPKSDGTLARFWETFIAPHEIRFEVARDYYQGTDVFRDALIHTKVTEGVEVQVPAYLLYQAKVTPEGLYAKRMAAHWSLPFMTLTAMRMGPRAMFAMTGLFARMFRVMGTGWVLDYLASFWRTVGSPGKRSLSALTDAFVLRDERMLASVFVAEGARVRVASRDGAPSELFAQWPEGSALSFERPVVAGWTVTAKYRVEGPEAGEGIVLLEFAPGTELVREARFFGG